jgi:hypothetical protein
MKTEYDFSNGVRGKYAKSGATYHIPVYLDSELQQSLMTKAEEQHIEFTVLVQRLLQSQVPAQSN